MKAYDFKSVEKKWQDKWEDAGVFHAVELRRNFSAEPDQEQNNVLNSNKQSSHKGLLRNESLRL